MKLTKQEIIQLINDNLTNVSDTTDINEVLKYISENNDKAPFIIIVDNYIEMPDSIIAKTSIFND